MRLIFFIIQDLVFDVHGSTDVSHPKTEGLTPIERKRSIESSQPSALSNQEKDSEGNL
jgi:hypothetical protein